MRRANIGHAPADPQHFQTWATKALYEIQSASHDEAVSDIAEIKRTSGNIAIADGEKWVAGTISDLPFADGTALLPGIVFAGDPDTGIYHTADIIGFSTAGVSRGTIQSTGWNGNVVGNVTGNVLGNINGTIGAITPAAGSFTTIAVSGTLTLGASSHISGFDDTDHGALGGGSLHSVATSSTAGFESAADKTKLDLLRPELPNLFVNPEHFINQARYLVPSALSGAWICDQWYQYFSTSAGVMAGQQVNVVSAKGSPFRSRINVNTIDASLAAGEFLIYSHVIEMWRIGPALFSTANAKQLLLRFGFSCTTGGTYAISVHNAALNRSYVKTFVAATGDNYYEFVIPGDTSGTWITAYNVAAMIVSIAMAAGSTYQGTDGAWQAGNILGVAGMTNGWGTVASFELFDCELYIDLHGYFPQWRPVDHNKNIRDCARYYQKSYDLFNNPGTITNNGRVLWQSTAASEYQPIPFPVRMRAAPTCTVYSPVTGTAGQVRDYSSVLDIATTTADQSENGFTKNSESTGAAGESIGLHWVASAIL